MRIDWYRLLRPLLFRLDAEAAHNVVFAALRQAQRVARRSGAAALSHPSLTQTLAGLTFTNPVGLAAGLDKNAVAPHVWPHLGFGFVELGTTTAQAQAGNPPPRLFRLPADRALVNRMGFNNDGAAAIAERLASQFQTRRPSVPIGLNFGKSRLTPIEAAVDDYLISLNHLFGFADYIVINVSSPNTPGLRDLQAEARLRALTSAMQQENVKMAAARNAAAKPLFIKLAPDLSDDALASAVQVALEERAAGVIATNTTLSRAGLSSACDEAGGLSGAPLRERSTRVVRQIYKLAGAALPIIGVGGIASAEDAYEKVRAGASLVQIYTGLIYEGPYLPRRIAAGLAALLQRDGLGHLSQAVGSDAV